MKRSWSRKRQRVFARALGAWMILGPSALLVGAGVVMVITTLIDSAMTAPMYLALGFYGFLASTMIWLGENA